MCGICGIIRPHKEVEPELLERMRDSLVHRGPDDAGLYLSEDKTVGFGHRRLSIIDLSSAGRQPISNEDQSVWVTYNGEIYNFQHLRHGLKMSGHRFKSRTDTEIIVHLYEEYGNDFVRLLDGQFAFGLWDDKKKKLLLARDRFGKKPLYYFYNGESFIFASEIKAILYCPEVKKQINLNALYDYLTFQYVPYPETIFEDIKKLPPSSYLTFQNGHIDIRPYYKLKLFNSAPEMSEEYYAERIHELLKESVKKRLISDVPLGVFLSGGIDSSSIVALMSELAVGSIKTFSVGFKDKEYSEANYAKEVALRFGTDHEEILLEPTSAWELIPEIAEQFDEPLADQAAVPTYLMSKIAKRKVTVCLSGEGGDEIFGGYPRYVHAIRNIELSEKLSLVNKEISEEITEALMPDMSEYVKSLCSFNEDEKKKLLRPSILEAIKKDRPSCYPHIERFKKFSKSIDYLKTLQYIDINTYLTDNLLVKVDRASMLASLEIRAPMLDHLLLEETLNLPYFLKVKGRVQKYLLRKIFVNKLPESVLWRPKMGFSMPLPKWFKGDLNDYAKDILLSWQPGREQYFNKTYIKKILEKNWYGDFSIALKIWTLLIFEQWRRKYNV